MAATYAIVYSTASKMHRRTIADDDGQVTVGIMPDGITPAVICSHPKAPPSYHPLQAGESAIAVTVTPTAVSAQGYSDWMAAIETATGTTPPVLTCALIDATNTVQHVIVADPDVDQAPSGFTMVKCYSPLIVPGCSYSPITGLFAAPAVTIPAGAPGNRLSALPKVIAATVIPNPSVIGSVKVGA